MFNFSDTLNFMDFIPLAFLEWAPAKNVSDRWAKYLLFTTTTFDEIVLAAIQIWMHVFLLTPLAEILPNFEKEILIQFTIYAFFNYQ
jgi:hypothetical protein